MKKYQDLLSNLPIDIQIHIFSYSNPYKDSFTRLILKDPKFWKITWLRYYKDIENIYEKMTMEYILGLFGITPKTKKFADYAFYSSKSDWFYTTYPNDIYFEIEPKTDKPIITIYKEMPISDTSKKDKSSCILGSYYIVFHCLITNAMQPLNQSYYPYNQYYYVYGDNEYYIYRYFGVGRPENRP